jgi:hypothetical protein
LLGRAAIAAARRSASSQRGDLPVRGDLPDSLVIDVGDIPVSRGVHRDRRRSVQLSREGQRTVARKAVAAVARDGCDVIRLTRSRAGKSQGGYGNCDSSHHEHLFSPDVFQNREMVTGRLKARPRNAVTRSCHALAFRSRESFLAKRIGAEQFRTDDPPPSVDLGHRNPKRVVPGRVAQHSRAALRVV